MHIKPWKLQENLLKKCQVHPASLIPHHTMDKPSFNIFQERPLVFHFFSQPPEFLLQGVDFLVDGFDFIGIG